MHGNIIKTHSNYFIYFQFLSISFKNKNCLKIEILRMISDQNRIPNELFWSEFYLVFCVGSQNCFKCDSKISVTTEKREVRQRLELNYWCKSLFVGATTRHFVRIQNNLRIFILYSFFFYFRLILLQHHTTLTIAATWATILQ